MAYGSVALDQITTSVPNVSLGAGNATIMKNKLINGAFVIDQRNNGGSITPTSTGTVNYCLDRWANVISQSSKFSIQQNAGAISPPAGFTNYLGVTSLSSYSISSSDYFLYSKELKDTMFLIWLGELPMQNSNIICLGL